MITTMRLPLYIALETENGLDRAKLVKMMEEHLIPDLLQTLISNGAKITVSMRKAKYIDQICQDCTIRILTGPEALQLRK
jgi:hypothetical protein